MERAEKVVGRAFTYLSKNPQEFLRAAKNVVGLRMGLPLAAIRWAVDQLPAKTAPKDVVIEAIPPGIRLAATIDAAGATIRVSTIFAIEDLIVRPGEFKFQLRFEEIDLKVLDGADTPVGALIASGALDLSKPGTLLSFMKNKFPFLISKGETRIEVDLAKLPAFHDAKVQKMLGLVTPFVTVSAVESDWDHLDIEFKVLQDGIGGLWQNIRSQFRR